MIKFQCGRCGCLQSGVSYLREVSHDDGLAGGCVAWWELQTEYDESMKWKTSDVDMSYHRYIKKIEGNVVTLDAPLYYTLDKTYAQAYIR